MPRARKKEDLQAAVKENFEKLNQLIDSLSERSCLFRQWEVQPLVSIL